MKPTRGPSGSWLRSMPRERRTALVSLILLVTLLGSLMAYQRFTAGRGSRMPPQPAQAQTPPDAEMPTDQVGEEPGREVTATHAAAGKTDTPAPAEPIHIVRPLSGERKVVQSYGFALSDVYGDFRLHPGVDYQATAGESVMAAAAGKVVSIDDDPADGKVLTLDHGNGLTTRYAGLGQVMVGVNAAVQSGNIVGQVGQPGPARASSGTHLHFEVLVNGAPVDPATYLSK